MPRIAATPAVARGRVQDPAGARGDEGVAVDLSVGVVQGHPDLLAAVLEAVDLLDAGHLQQRLAACRPGIHTVRIRVALTCASWEVWSSVKQTTSHRPDPGWTRPAASCSASASSGRPSGTGSSPGRRGSGSRRRRRRTGPAGSHWPAPPRRGRADTGRCWAGGCGSAGPQRWPPIPGGRVIAHLIAAFGAGDLTDVHDGALTRLVVEEEDVAPIGQLRMGDVH